MMKKLKIKLARLFHKESGARCRSRVRRSLRELYSRGVIYNIITDGEYGYYRNY